MRIKRSKKEYGGGSGHDIFESDSFRVVMWKLQKGIKTTIECKLIDSMEFNFDGKQEFISDKLCIEQLSSIEIIRIFKAIKKQAFTEGRISKAKEIISCLESEN